MKNTIYLLFIVLLTVSFSTPHNHEVPELKTTTDVFKFKINNEVEETELPLKSINTDTFVFTIIADNIDFTVYSDIDSVKAKISSGEIFTFKISKKNTKPLFVCIKNRLDTEAIEFTNTKNNDLYFLYEQDTEKDYFKKLRSLYPIDSIAAQGDTQLDKVRLIATWVHNLWQHDGDNPADKNDALYILNEVMKGKRFRCVEYGIVTTACLNSIGIKSRTLALKIKDVENTPYGAGHVLMEVYLNDLNKWVMVDPQWDVITHINGVPLNAVELQQAATKSDNIELWSSEDISASGYIEWIYPYLYYFSVSFDNRENITGGERLKINGKTDLMLVPLSAKNPTVFQQLYPIDYCIYTNSVMDFYRNPNE